MGPVAKEVVAKAKAAKDDPEFLFFTAFTPGGVVPRIRELCKLDKENEKAEPTLVLLDVNDEGAYYRPEHSITEAGIRSLLEDYRAKKLTPAVRPVSGESGAWSSGGTTVQ